MSGTVGPVALLTGVGGGLGPAVCAALATDGFTVLAADLDGDAAKRAVADIDRAEPLTLDVVDGEAVDAVLDSLMTRFGRIDAVVNMAGVARNQMLHKIVDADFDLTIRTHVNGTLNTMRAAIPHMKRVGYGRIVNFSSVAIRGALAGGAYGAAKGAVEALTRTAAIEVARNGITVNCVAPGVIAAGMFLTTPEDYRRERVAKVPMGRAGSADEVAAAVSFFVSARASYVTGQSLFVCGGLTIGI